MTERLSVKEMRAMAVGFRAVGYPLGASFFSMFRFISKKRAVELEELQMTLTQEELDRIVSINEAEPR